MHVLMAKPSAAVRRGKTHGQRRFRSVHHTIRRASIVILFMQNIYMTHIDKLATHQQKNLLNSRLFAAARTASRGPHDMFGIAARLLPVL